MNIERPSYIDKLLKKRWNGKVKIITGIRRCGKSYLLRVLYKQALLKKGIAESAFIEIDLEKAEFADFRNPITLHDYIREKCKDKRRKYYVFIDEIQRSYKIKNTSINESQVADEDKDLLYTTFYDTLSSLMALPNIDIYVTGSNSKMLSTDIVTNFRDRGYEIKVSPLSFAEFYTYRHIEKHDALEEYLTYGGMPLAVLENDEKEKRHYLANLHRDVYLKDIVERYALNDDSVIDALTNAIYSSIGSLTNPHKLSMTTKSLMRRNTSDTTIKKYLDLLEDSFLISKTQRYDIKGKRYFASTLKYYATDLGLRNARLNFRQQEHSHLMENMLYNELIRRGYSVDVGVVEITVTKDNKREQRQYEIDFVVNTGNRKIYIQSALNVYTKEKKEQETFSLHHSEDFFRKIVVLGGNEHQWTDEDGIEYIGIIPFLLQDDIL